MNFIGNNYKTGTPWYGEVPSWVGQRTGGAYASALQELTNPITGETWTAPNSSYYVKDNITQTPQTSTPKWGAPTFTPSDGTVIGNQYSGTQLPNFNYSPNYSTIYQQAPEQNNSSMYRPNTTYYQGMLGGAIGPQYGSSSWGYNPFFGGQVFNPYAQPIQQQTFRSPYQPWYRQPSYGYYNPQPQPQPQPRPRPQLGDSGSSDSDNIFGQSPQLSAWEQDTQVANMPDWQKGLMSVIPGVGPLLGLSHYQAGINPFAAGVNEMNDALGLGMDYTPTYGDSYGGAGAGIAGVYDIGAGEQRDMLIEQERDFWESEAEEAAWNAVSGTDYGGGYSGWESGYDGPYGSDDEIGYEDPGGDDSGGGGDDSGGFGDSYGGGDYGGYDDAQAEADMGW